MGSVEALFHNSDHKDPDAVEFILLGTGTSSTLPHVDCLTRPPGAKQCRACLATLDPAGRKNKRGNTSAVARIRGKDGELKTIVIDVGKSFLHSAVEWFPKHGLRRIDAVLITHAHADAMNGLDDLRGWTLGGAIQPHVDIYLSQETYEAVKLTFPYLVQKEFATGGGDVPEFKWHPCVNDRQPFEIGDTGIRIQPFTVPHGFCGAPPPKPALPIPNQGAAHSEAESPCGSGLPGTPVSTGIVTPPNQGEEFLCFGFIIHDAVMYISDASRIPNHVLDYLRKSQSPNGHKPPVLILDCLSLNSHRSHLSLSESVRYARQINAQKTYLVGFSHNVAHDEYETLLKAVSSGRPPQEMTDAVRRGLEQLDLNGDRIWIRPAFDGLRILVSDGHAQDIEGDDDA